MIDLEDDGIQTMDCLIASDWDQNLALMSTIGSMPTDVWDYEAYHIFKTHIDSTSVLMWARLVA